jgi:hypothetical protein
MPAFEGEPGVRAAYLKERCRALPGETDPQLTPLTAAVTSPVCGAAAGRYRHNGTRFHLPHRLYAPGERLGGPPLTPYLRTGRILHIRARRVL